MARPEQFEDLPAYELSEPVVAKINVSELVQTPLQVAHAMLAVLAEAEKHGLHVNREEGEVTRALTIDEKLKALKAQQDIWDARESNYHEASVDPSSLDTWKRWSVDKHAKAEGLRPIEWPDDESSDVL